MELLKKLRRHLVVMENWLAAASLLVLIVLALVQIVARNLFDTGFANVDTLTRYLVLYVTFFGAAVAVTRERHIKIDVCCTMLKPGTLERLYRPMRALAALVCGLLAYAAIRFWRDEWLYAPAHEHWQQFISVIIPVGFVILKEHFLLDTVLGLDEDSCCRL